jgi:hypothetical protein
MRWSVRLRTLSEKMRDYISASGSADREYLEADNAFGPIYRTFGEGLWPHPGRIALLRRGSIEVTGIAL